MDRTQATRAFLLGQCARYTGLQIRDLLKGLHQSVYGGGHFVTDEEAGIRFLRREMQEAPSAPGPAVELLDGDCCRVHLQWARARGLAPETLQRLFAVSAEEFCGTEEDCRAMLEEKLTVLEELAREGALPFSAADVEKAVADYREAGFPACHHSQPVRELWAPAYRLIHTDYLRLLPILMEIDRRRGKKRRTIVAVEGGAGSGKTTLSALLQRLYGCTVLHMDDFFLRPEQRTQERLATPGENIDHERFAAEVLKPLAAGEPIAYRRYDCATQTVLEAEEIRPEPLVVVEGAYSMHPALADYYDYSVFLDVPQELQYARIEARNTPEMQEKFFSQWIPMEQAYFAAMDPKGRCDYVVEVKA